MHGWSLKCQSYIVYCGEENQWFCFYVDFTSRSVADALDRGASEMPSLGGDGPGKRAMQGDRLRKDRGFLLTEGFVQAYNLRLAASVCLDLAARRTSSLALTMEHKASDRVCLWIISSLIRRLFSFVGLAVGHACVWQGRLILVRGGFATHVDSAKDYGHGASAVTTSLLKLKDLGR